MHKDVFDEMLVLWEDLAVVRGLPHHSPAIEHDAARNINKSRKHVITWLCGSLAAAMVLAAALLLLPSSIRYETAHGEITQVVLSDGSTLHLSTETEVDVNLKDKVRRVELLQGQVFFRVAKDAARPFVVHTRFGDAKAIGTAFEVNILHHDLVVTVSDGIVEVSTPQGTHDLVTADQQLRVAKGAITEQAIDAAAVTAWQDGKLVYDGVPLGELIADLNRYLPLKMTVADSKLARTPVSAVLRLEDQKLMLRALSHSLPLKWQAVTDNLIIIQSRKPT